MEISSKRLGAAAVLDEAQRIAGIITDGDLRRMLQREHIDLARLTAAEIMSRTPKTIGPDAMAVDALALMRAHSITQLLVATEDGGYLGIVHLHDLVREGLV